MSVPPLALVQLFGAAIAIGLAAYASRHRDQPGLVWLVAVLVGDAVWMVAAGVNYATGSLALSTAMLQFRYVGITVIPVALLFFALAYTGYDSQLTPRRRGLIALPAAAVLVIVLTDGLHGLFYASVTSASNPQSVAYEYGLVAVPWILYAFVLVLVAGATFVKYALVTDHVYRLQALALAGVISVGVVADLLFFLPVPPTGFSITPLAILLSCALAIGIVVQYDFVRLVPATRELGRNELIERMELGMVVLNADRRVADVNPAAAEILGRETGALLGEPAPDMLPDPDGQSVVKRTVTIDGVDRDVEIRTNRVDELAGVTVVTLQLIDDFTNIVSHDLQGPLMEIRGSADLAMRSGDMTHVDRVLSGANRIDELVTDLLHLDRTGRELETRTPVELDELASTAWTHIWSPGAALSVETDRCVIGDPHRLQQLFENLFQNSVDHGTPAGRSDDAPSRPESVSESHSPSSEPTTGSAPPWTSAAGTDGDPESPDSLRVVVGTLPDGFYVEDDGPGIDPDVRERIFEKGYTDSPTGTGLGLSIVRQIAHAHGWSVRATAGSLGGARFEFTGVEFDDDATVS